MPQATGTAAGPDGASPPPCRHSQLAMLALDSASRFWLLQAGAIDTPLRLPPAVTDRLPPRSGYQTRARLAPPPSTNFS